MDKKLEDHYEWLNLGTVLVNNTFTAPSYQVHQADIADFDPVYLSKWDVLVFWKGCSKPRQGRRGDVTIVTFYDVQYITTVFNLCYVGLLITR